MNHVANASAYMALQASTGEALKCLRTGPLSDARVHQARKALKRARAALRLLRPALDDAVYRRENYALRDAGRCLSPLRDARALRAAVDTFAKSIGRRGAGAAGAVALLRNALQQRLEQQRREFARPGACGRCIELVSACREGLPPVAATRASQFEGFRKIYRKARKAFAAAAQIRSSAALHEWRKQTKYLQGAARVLHDAGASHLKKISDHAGDIADWLGEDHDLAGLRDQIVSLPLNPVEAVLLLQVIDECRERLQQRAFALGESTFSPKPKRIASQVLASAG